MTRELDYKPYGVLRTNYHSPQFRNVVRKYYQELFPTLAEWIQAQLSIETIRFISKVLNDEMVLGYVIREFEKLAPNSNYEFRFNYNNHTFTISVYDHGDCTVARMVITT